MDPKILKHDIDNKNILIDIGKTDEEIIIEGVTNDITENKNNNESKCDVIELAKDACHIPP